jgi:glycolate oxidase iron-sulfur subunit
MQTSLKESLLKTAEGQEADRILRKCVHCGFCTATCPTYQLLGDEQDGPRGRIYMIKSMLEGEATGKETQLHLDRCLTCRSCESTCPSGVQYGRLLEIGRHQLEKEVPRPLFDRVQRWLLRQVIPYPQRFTPLLRIGQLFKPLLPSALADSVPERRVSIGRPQRQHDRKMLLLEGCAQTALVPSINDAAVQILDRLGIELFSINTAGCCGALSQHLSADQQAQVMMKQNIDAWWPHIEAGAEAIVSTASGCGAQLEEYGYLLSHDSRYAEKAARVTSLAKDLVEVVDVENIEPIVPKNSAKKIAFQAPCSLQHGQQIKDRVERLLKALGYELTFVADPHLCCGSAGTYSITQPEISGRLQANKIKNLQAGKPDIIATANIGCYKHLEQVAEVPVRHWVEIVVEGLG